MWLGFPSHAELWEADLEPARAEVIALAEGLHAGGAGEEVRLVAADAEAAAAARLAAGGRFRVVVAPFGDIWLRDTGPIVLGSGANRHARTFAFNGWGGKYELEGDESIGRDLAASARLPVDGRDWVLEGGAIHGNGTGLVVTAEQCVLNAKPNSGL